MFSMLFVTHLSSEVLVLVKQSGVSLPSARKAKIKMLTDFLDINLFIELFYICNHSHVQENSSLAKCLLIKKDL